MLLSNARYLLYEGRDQEIFANVDMADNYTPGKIQNVASER